MWIFLLEAGLVLALMALIVWWTWPRPEQEHKDDSEPK